ncbi:hypothetical protein B0H13DRAFT_2389951 [Mycena leptocephala]|nr:hypothetical protein B0H13DRAFT_2389951 [Mycena leptocephala]
MRSRDAFVWRCVPTSPGRLSALSSLLIAPPFDDTIGAAFAQPLHRVPNPRPLFVYSPYATLVAAAAAYSCFGLSVTSAIHRIPIRRASLVTAYLRLHCGKQVRLPVSSCRAVLNLTKDQGYWTTPLRTRLDSSRRNACDL